MNHRLTLYLSFPLFRLLSGNLRRRVWACTLRVYKVFTKNSWGPWLRETLPWAAGVISCTPPSALSFRVRLFPGRRGYTMGTPSPPATMGEHCQAREGTSRHLLPSSPALRACSHLTASGSTGSERSRASPWGMQPRAQARRLESQALSSVPTTCLRRLLEASQASW